MTVIPEGYRLCIAAMFARARRWVARRGLDGLAFHLPPLEVMLIASLDEKTCEILARSEQSRAFLRALDEATQNEATVAQACIVIRELGLPVTDWSESFLAELTARNAGRA